MSSSQAKEIIDKYPENKDWTSENNNRKSVLINFKSKIQPNYRKKRDNLKNTFLPAFNFLTYAENNDKGIWLGTSVNVHLYFKKYYLAYIIIGHDNLAFRAKYNNLIYFGTIDKSNVMFSNEFNKLIQHHDGFKNGWASKRGEKYYFYRSTPYTFIKSLVDYIYKLPLK